MCTTLLAEGSVEARWTETGEVAEHAGRRSVRAEAVVATARTAHGHRRAVRGDVKLTGVDL